MSKIALLAIALLWLTPGKVMAQDDLESAYKAYIKMDIDSARAILEPMTLNESNPVKLTRAYKLLGIVAYMQGQMDFAASSFKKSLDIDPGATISKSEVLDESVITYFQKIKDMTKAEVKDVAGKDPKKKKKRYKIIKKRRELYAQERALALFPFGSGQFMHKQYLFGSVSAGLQAGSLIYAFMLTQDISNSEKNEDVVQNSDVADIVKQRYSEEQTSYRSQKQKSFNLAIGAFVTFWAISSVDAWITPKYKKVKRRIKKKKKKDKDKIKEIETTWNGKPVFQQFSLELSPKGKKDELLISADFNF